MDFLSGYEASPIVIISLYLGVNAVYKAATAKAYRFFVWSLRVARELT